MLFIYINILKIQSNRKITIIKLINTNRNIERIFLSVNYSEFYQQKYSLGIYQETYSEKKKTKSMMMYHLYQ